MLYKQNFTIIKNKNMVSNCLSFVSGQSQCMYSNKYFYY